MVLRCIFVSDDYVLTLNLNISEFRAATKLNVLNITVHFPHRYGIPAVGWRLATALAISE